MSTGEFQAQVATEAWKLADALYAWHALLARRNHHLPLVEALERQRNLVVKMYSAEMLYVKNE